MGRRNRNKQRKPDVWDQSKTGYKNIVTENEKLEKYYRSLNFIPPEEYERMMAAFRTELPVAFRLTGGQKTSDRVRNVLETRYFSQIEGLKVEDDGKEIVKPTALPWYPGGMAFSLPFPRKVMRRSMILNNLHNFLITESSAGTLSRQEAVSMLPPLFMNIQRGHVILDMCAAPGSKTAQIIELLEGTNQSVGGRDESAETVTSVPADDASKSMPKAVSNVSEGLVVANDCDNKRCYLLVHQALKRLVTPSCLVTNHDAAVFPNISVMSEKGDLEYLEYDRILCDVPCSGDGTLRKNPDIWINWKPQNAHNLHIIQTRIAKRAVELLKVGGRMVYSTCSLNPTENEASVLAVLEFAQGSCELVDVSQELPQLKRLPGLHDWKVIDAQGNFVESYDAVAPRDRGPLPSTIFPNPELARKHKLERCFRVLPHFHDTGSFFVAVITKTAPLPWVAPRNAANGQETNPDSKTPPRKKAKLVNAGNRRWGYREDPFVFPPPDELAAISSPIKEYFGISDDFPFEQLLCRCESGTESKNRNFYFTNALATDVLRNNDLNRLKVINAGVRIFTRVESSAGGFRLAQDGFKILAPHVSKRIFDVSREDAVKILTAPKAADLGDLSDEFQKELEHIEEGSAGVRCKNNAGEVVCFVVFRGKSTVAPYIAKEVRLHFLRLLDYDTTQIEQELVSCRRQRNAAAQNGQNDRDKVDKDEKGDDGAEELEDNREVDNETDGVSELLIGDGNQSEEKIV